VKDNSEFTFKLGIVDGKVINVQEITELANMPGKEELFSKLLFLINAPAQRLATVINATGRDLAVVINQGVEKEKFSGSAPAAKIEEAAPVAEATTEVAAAHVEESAATEQPSGAAQPENATASQAGEAAGSEPVEG
jgi:large subunit ribosomal protein L10